MSTTQSRRTLRSAITKLPRLKRQGREVNTRHTQCPPSARSVSVLRGPSVIDHGALGGASSHPRNRKSMTYTHYRPGSELASYLLCRYTRAAAAAVSQRLLATRCMLAVTPS